MEPLSDIVFLIAALSLAGWIVYKRPADPAEFSRDLVASSLLFAAVSYYLGRSHPNNICNLMPFVALVGMRALKRPAVRGQTIVGLATATAAITLSPWNHPPFERWRVGGPGLTSPDRSGCDTRADRQSSARGHRRFRTAHDPQSIRERRLDCDGSWCALARDPQ
jgi:hypothetical protein